MGSSAKKKKEKKKDFQRPKLRVGKSKPKSSNFTDTSFKAKSIVVNKQSISTTAPSPLTQFSHHISLLRHKSHTQRFESLAYLTNAINSSTYHETAAPYTPSLLLPKLQPLIVDGSSAVRQQLLKLFKSIPAKEVSRQPEQLLLYIRAGMTHLSADIRSDSMDYLEWLISVAGDETVSCAGGWVKILGCFMALLGWQQQSAKVQGWSTYQRSSNKPGTENKAIAKQLHTLAAFIHAGISPPSKAEIEKAATQAVSFFPLRQIETHLLPERPHAYAHLNLFGQQHEDESALYEDREERRRVFAEQFQNIIQKGILEIKKEGGELGREAATLDKVVKEGMSN